MELRGRPLAYEQAGTGIAHVVMENLALGQRLRNIVRYGGTTPLPIFLQLRLRLTFCGRCGTLHVTVPDAPFLRAQYPCNTSVEETSTRRSTLTVLYSS